MGDKKEIHVLNMNVQTKTNEHMTAISCPACGAGAAYGQAGCGFCGSGLLKNVDSVQGKFGIPSNSTEWKVGDQILESEELPSILQRMEEKTPAGEYSYAMWGGIPVIVGGDIDAKKARQNLRDTVKQIGREKLGTKWTRALDEFHGLQKDLFAIGDEKRLALGTRYYDEMKDVAYLDSETFLFFEKPTFSNFEVFTNGLKKMDDDAEQVRHGIERVKSLMTPSVE